VRFNYLGQLDQVLSESALFEVDRTPARAAAHEGNRRYLLDISGFVLGGQLNWSGCTASRCIDEPALKGWLKGLSRRSLISHCQSPEAGGYTPSDFPAANLSQKTWSSFVENQPRSEKTSK